MKFFLKPKKVPGPWQFKALKLLIERGEEALPRPGEVTYTGKLRFHTFTDLIPHGLARYKDAGKVDPETGLVMVKVVPTAKGERFYESVTKVAKAPVRRVKARTVSHAYVSRVTRGRASQRLHS